MSGTNARSRPVYRGSEGLGSCQPGLFVVSDDRLEGDHFVRRLRSLVEDLFGEELRSRSNLSGGFSYDPVLLASVWIYGFLDGNLTSRRLETLCRYDARYEYLAGSCRFDHTTLSRFRCSWGEAMDEAMARLLLVSQQMGILQRRTMVVDGTKIAAVRSQWRKVRKEADAQEALESEAVTMVSHGKYLVGYNVQVAADLDSGLLVGYVATNAPSDVSVLGEVCETVKRQSGALSEQAVCDRGYDSSTNAVALAEQGAWEEGSVLFERLGEDGLPSRARGDEVGVDGSGKWKGLRPLPSEPVLEV